MWQQKQRSEWCIYKPRDTEDFWKLRRGRKDSSPEPSEQDWSCWCLGFKLWPPELRGNTFLLSHQVSGNLLRQPQDTHTIPKYSLSARLFSRPVVGWACVALCWVRELAKGSEVRGRVPPLVFSLMLPWLHIVFLQSHSWPSTGFTAGWMQCSPVFRCWLLSPSPSLMEFREIFDFGVRVTFFWILAPSLSYWDFHSSQI